MTYYDHGDKEKTTIGILFVLLVVLIISNFNRAGFIYLYVAIIALIGILIILLNKKNKRRRIAMKRRGK